MKRLFFPLITLFWVIMNILLWRSEMSSAQEAGTAVPVAGVWERILRAPDDSALEIVRAGQKLGYCRWQTVVGGSAKANAPEGPTDELEGRVRGPANYTITFSGNIRLADPDQAPQTVRFEAHAQFATNHLCRHFRLRLTARPNVLDLEADFTRQTLACKLDNAGVAFDRTFTFDELRQPDVVLAALGLPWATAWLGQFTGHSGSMGLPSLALGLTWNARSDWMKFGQARTRVYRLQAHLFDQYEAVVVVSRVGEILRVDLPGDIHLANEALPNL